MSDKQPAYEFNETPVTVILNYDTPKTGKSQGKNGEYTWYMYSAKINGEDRIFFATEDLHSAIQEKQLKKGSLFQIAQIPRINSKSGKAYKSLELVGEVPQNGSNEATGQSGKPTQEYWERKEAKKNDSIKWLNALNNSTLLTCAIINENKRLEGDVNIENTLINLANFIYNLNPIFTPEGDLKDNG